MEIFDRVTVEIIDYDVHGKGIGKKGSAVIFLNGGEIGDIVEVEILKKKKRFYEAEIVDYVEKSPLRVENPCPYHRCSGCSFLSLSRDAELAWKKDRVESALARIGGVLPRIEDVKTAGDIFGYRNHTQFHVSDRKLCLYGKGRERIPIRRCIMQPERANDILSAMQGAKWLDGIDLVGIRTSRRGESMLILVGKEPLRDRKLHDVVSFAVDEEIDSVYYSQNANPRRHYGKTWRHVYGKKAIEETLAGYRYDVAAGNFFQVNPFGAEIIVEEVKKHLDPAKTIVELYAGIGTITLPVSEKAGTVIGNELSESSVDYARKTAKENGVKNVRYIAGAAETMMPRIAEEEAIDGLIVDPPRAGLQPAVVDTVLKTLPKQMIYISCNPSTLARDLSRLRDAYRVEIVQPIDMFPHTSHVETVVLMSRK
ncbi:MAG: 23S rRNA (uracil(1939)-C(5))-methyltransferase RlmD [Peptoniphilus sp.]|nr:23S rRNA (uracil(1939)-C(5))-methyltransferase RlmD [Peptoniphilus sp.]MDD7363623.1 23S rRNA (uracil(1939)-C(5))-methyltransferase RlmD [Bacillota bacterium]MDY6044732.1 23S rRNA (uracil(1939)-C(5))-methyltransferase RlmD [Peptoniphilus sp.]